MSEVPREAWQAGYGAVENQLIELRDRCIGLLNAPNGLVVREADGTGSAIVRMKTAQAVKVALEAAAPYIRAAALEEAAKPDWGRIEQALEELWDAGNATGLDGWIGPGRGAGEVDDEAVRARTREVARVLDAIASGLRGTAEKEAG